jgi:hypothetical protein
MGLELNRIEEPFVFELKNDEGVICGIDANPSIGLQLGTIFLNYNS